MAMVIVWNAAFVAINGHEYMWLPQVVPVGVTLDRI